MTTLLLTGATGSFGRAFIEAALGAGWFERIIAFSDTESNQSLMKRALPPSPRLEYFIGNVRDYDRVRWAMRAGVDVVLHAAAMKEVPTCEYDWPEAVATNVDGSRNVALAAVECGVRTALLVSTDKAVDAVTEYGKTKAMAESWFIRANRGYADAVEFRRNAQHGHRTRLGVVRYGNVLGSRASILPLARAHLAAGEALPITDMRMTRFWWTLDQAVAFVKHVLDHVGPGQIWIPRVRAAPVLALMKALGATTANLTPIGIRGKEKLHEVLLSSDEARYAYVTPEAVVVQPANASWPTTAVGAPAPCGFSYRSDDQDRWMTLEELRSLIAEAEKKAS